MYRFIDDFLIKWKTEKRRKPLIIRGARQVGKTYSITHFAANNFKNLIKIDFEREPGLKNIFDHDLDPKRISKELELIKNIKIERENTLLFFDEIQECSNAIMSLRYFYEEMPELHIIATGSLLEFAMSEMSFPVGRIQFYEMHPLSFPEFLLASNKQNLFEHLIDKPHNLPETVHNLLLKDLKYYFFIGGMPESVKTYSETGSIRNCSEVHSEIVNSLRMDFAKYSPQVDKNCLNSALTEVARNVGKQTKYSSLAQGFSNPTLKKAYQALQMSKLIYQIKAINPIGFPVQLISGRIFKTALLDVGIMNFLCGIQPNEEFINSDLLSIYRGALAEQYVAQEFAITQQNDVYYWERQARGSTAEVDFVIENNNKWFPVEVKSGSSGALRSLHLYLQEYSQTTEAYVLSSQPYSELMEQKLKFVPIYFAYSLSKMI